MTHEERWPEMDRAIAAARNTRDRHARAAQEAAKLSVPTLAHELELLAASCDRLLARLIELKAAGRGRPAGRP